MVRWSTHGDFRYAQAHHRRHGPRLHRFTRPGPIDRQVRVHARGDERRHDEKDDQDQEEIVQEERRYDDDDEVIGAN